MRPGEPGHWLTCVVAGGRDIGPSSSDSSPESPSSTRIAASYVVTSPPSGPMITVAPRSRSTGTS